MAPPDFQDSLAADPVDPDLERELREINKALDECEEDLAMVDRTVTVVRQDMNEFVAFLRECPDVTEDDLVRLFKRIVQQEIRFRLILDQCRLRDEIHRPAAAALQNSRLRARLLEICDRRIEMLELALETCEAGKQTLRDMSDELANLEAQGMFLDPFWDDQVN